MWMSAAEGRKTCFREGRRYTVEGRRVPSVTEVLNISGLVDLAFLDQDMLAKAAERGTTVHRLCELYDREVLDWATVPSEFTGYLDGWLQFREDSGFEPALIEEPVFNARLRYAGTLDRTGYPRKHGTFRGIYDIKTGRALQPTTAYQLAGYKLALPLDGLDEDNEYRRFAVRLDGAGHYELKEYTDPEDEQVFLAALRIAHVKLRLRKATLKD